MTLNVGVDVSKDHLDWAASAQSPVERIPNDTRGIRRLLKHLSRIPIERVVVEATGGYERALVQTLIDWNELLGVSCNRLLDGMPAREP